MERFDKWVMLLIGLVGGWVISTAPGWLHASSHEHWWDIATALGTVGAVWFAVWQSVRLKNAKLDEERSRLSAVAITLDEALASLGWVIGHLQDVSRGKSILNVDEVKGFLYSATVVEAIPFHEYPYCKAYKDILQTVLKIKTAAHLTSAYLDGKTDDSVLKDLKHNWHLACDELAEALSKPSFDGVQRVISGYTLPFSA